MKFLENIINKADSLINPEQNSFEVVQGAQMELIRRAGGDEFAGTWIDANSARFRELIDDPNNNFVERLVNENTREDALNEIQTKLYH
ncbi:MAG: hypothetical protein HZB12_03350 [Candidatus Yonathbacteria bacterium]|nr:hypothetical protein [Candidatus Yonathbacteria bacterium]